MKKNEGTNEGTYVYVYTCTSGSTSWEVRKCFRKYQSFESTKVQRTTTFVSISESTVHYALRVPPYFRTSVHFLHKCVPFSLVRGVKAECQLNSSREQHSIRRMGVPTKKELKSTLISVGTAEHTLRENVSRLSEDSLDPHLIAAALTAIRRELRTSPVGPGWIVKVRFNLDRPLTFCF